MPDISKLGPVFHRFGHTTVKILMVVDSNIDTVEAPGAFGIGRVVRLIQSLTRGCTSFAVSTARREPHFDAPENVGHISTSFRFDASAGGARVIDGFDEIWLFGFRGEGSLALDSDELRVLTDWMNRGGGIFATGDHFDLGAAMGATIPRVREMRRWTVADGVPPAGGRTRLDTNRPTSAAEANGSSPMTFAHERDAVPQAIEWSVVSSFRSGLRLYQRPHEVLCHPDLGPINVMPDHPHEGRTREVGEMNLGRSYNFGGGISGKDFPKVGSDQPLPLVIAHGETFPAPPSSKPYKPPGADLFRFPMISVYDGRSVGVKGRVAVDSTWHHWFDLNLYGLEHAADDTAWRKIARYFENLAVWLAPPGGVHLKCWLISEWFRYPLLEELAHRDLTLDAVPLDIGATVRERFIKTFGPCTTSSFVWGSLCELSPRLCKGLERFDPWRFREPIPPLCLSCPPFELLEEVVLAGLMQGTIPFMRAYAGRGDELAKMGEAKLEKLLDAHLAPALEKAVGHFAGSVVKDLEADLKAWQRVTKPSGGKRQRS
jgi:hypothetical protein